MIDSDQDPKKSLFLTKLQLPDGKFIRYVVNGLCFYGFNYMNPKLDENLFKHFEEMNSRLKYLKLKPGDVMIDVGASVGSWATHAARYGAKVYAFEVGEPQLKTLVYNRYLNYMDELITVYDIALCSNDDKEMVFDGKMNVCNKDPLNPFLLGFPEVKSITLDSFVKEIEIQKIDFIKIDVEGGEYDVLLGAVDTLKRFKPKLIIEIHEKIVGLRHDVETLLQDLGYSHEHKPPLHDYFF